jgi:hypothetical protein
MVSIYRAKDNRRPDAFNPLRGLNICRLLSMLEAFFPGRPALAYFEFSPVVPDQTRQVVQDAADLAKAGLKMDAGEVAEKTGYRVDTDRRLKTGFTSKARRL